MAIREMRKLYKKYNPDIIHLHSSKAGMLGRVAFPRNKTVYTVHGFDSIRLAYRKFLPIEKMMQHMCSAIVGVSKYDERNLHAEGILNNVHVIYNGIYPPTPLDQDPFTDYRKKYKGVILSIARLAPQKNHVLFCELAKRFPDYAFLWIGNNQEPDFDFPENVYFLGNIQHAGSYIKYSDMFMLLSNYEGLPIVIIESLASGIPVVASNVGGITELLDGEFGFALNNDVDEMASYVEKVLSYSKEKREKVALDARKKFNDEFTIDSMGSEYLALYNEIHNKNKHR